MGPEDLAILLNIPRLGIYLSRLEKELNMIIESSGSALSRPAVELLTSGGKRLRPLIAIASALMPGGALDERTMAAAKAVELVHLASLAHDDLIDGATRRRGRASLHRQEGIFISLLTGDYLLALAGAQAAQHSRELAGQVSKTITAMADGQAQQFGEDYVADSNNRVYLGVVQKKTGSLFATACWSGGLSAGVKATQLRALAQYGMAFGTAFQIVDDLVDEEFPTGLRAKATAQAKKYNVQAERALRTFDNSPIRDGLSRLPSYYLDWALPAKVL